MDSNLQQHGNSGLGEGGSFEATLMAWKNEASKVEDGRETVKERKRKNVKKN